MTVYGTGSTGYTSAYRIHQTIRTFFDAPVHSQTTELFQTLWDARTGIDVHLDYTIGGGEENSGSGWYNYLRRLHGSTRNTSTKSASGILGCPDSVFKNFQADYKVMYNDYKLVPAWAASNDANYGKRIYDILFTTHMESEKYRVNGQYTELLAAWGALMHGIITSVSSSS